MKLDKVKFRKQNNGRNVVFADSKISKESRAALASAWNADDEATARSTCGIGYATPCPRLGLCSV